jgi:hypothetical protein
LKTWFRWRSNSTTRKKAAPIVLKPSSRLLQDTEIYSQLYYEKKLKAIVAEETKGLSPRERFVKSREVTRREWDNESDEVKAEVQARKEELSKERMDADDMESTPQQRQAAIHDLGHTVDCFLAHIKKKTGWTGFIVLGGPNPEMGEQIAVTSSVLL